MLGEDNRVLLTDKVAGHECSQENKYHIILKSIYKQKTIVIFRRNFFAISKSHWILLELILRRWNRFLWFSISIWLELVLLH